MARPRKNKKLEVFRLSRSACLTMITSAAEVYPRECMGGLCCLDDKPSTVLTAFPWQKAKRKYLEVVSESSWEFSKIMRENKCQWSLLGDYHSHTYRSNEALGELIPSKQDLNSLDVGGVEFIVRIHKKKSNAFWMTEHEDGYVEAALGKFRFMIKAFERLSALDSKKVPLYKTLRVRLAR